ncbi:MAG: SPFH domain-containing protein [Acidobacteriota bacterium]|nr:MAG: SPFH domain-containing protein [Acidobacteriota bacterium]
MGLFVEVIEWRQDDGLEIVHRFEPGGEIKLGAQLVVTENQWAVFFRDGRAYDTFGAGRHTLTTANIPLLVELFKLPFGSKSPFRADVYFVARKAFTELRWGTRDPVVFRDPEFDMVRLRAHGRFALRVADPHTLVNTLVGTMGRYSTEDIEDYLRQVIVARLNDVLGESDTPLLELPRMYDELAATLSERVAKDFGAFGLALENLVIAAITPPAEVARIIDERSGMAAVNMRGSYIGFKAARALGDAAAAEGGAAPGPATEGMGLGVGAGLGMALPGLLRDALSAGTPRPALAAGQSPASQTDATAPSGPSETSGPTATGAKRAGPSATATAVEAACGECRAALPEASRFCPMCGTRVGPKSCGPCGAELPEGARFCPQCGAKKQ